MVAVPAARRLLPDVAALPRPVPLAMGVREPERELSDRQPLVQPRDLHLIKQRADRELRLPRVHSGRLGLYLEPAARAAPRSRQAVRVQQPVEGLGCHTDRTVPVLDSSQSTGSSTRCGRTPPAATVKLS